MGYDRERSEILKYPKQVLDRRHTRHSGKHKKKTLLDHLLKIESMVQKMPNDVPPNQCSQAQNVIDRISDALAQLRSNLCVETNK